MLATMASTKHPKKSATSEPMDVPSAASVLIHKLAGVMSTVEHWTDLKRTLAFSEEQILAAIGRTRETSALGRAGDVAKWRIERLLLLKTLRANHWNLTHTADALEMHNPSAVLRAIDRYIVRREYEDGRSG